MATATTPADSLGGATTRPGAPSWTSTLRFDVYEEDAGRHRWRLGTRGGELLAKSCESFASRDDAERAAEHDQGAVMFEEIFCTEPSCDTVGGRYGAYCEMYGHHKRVVRDLAARPYAGVRARRFARRAFRT
jgi:uncharacterized protein YegP (UPF0339 family)